MALYGRAGSPPGSPRSLLPSQWRMGNGGVETQRPPERGPKCRTSQRSHGVSVWGVDKEKLKPAQVALYPAAAFARLRFPRHRGRDKIWEVWCVWGSGSNCPSPLWVICVRRFAIRHIEPRTGGRYLRISRVVALGVGSRRGDQFALEPLVALRKPLRNLGTVRGPG
jgi:hypothetical protein